MSDILLEPKSDGAKRRTVLPIVNDTIIVEGEETGIEWKLVRNTTCMFSTPLGFWQEEVWPSRDHYCPRHIAEPDVLCLSEGRGGGVPL